MTAALTLTCPRCGAPLPALADLADVAVRADAALSRMRLAVPDDLRVGVRVLAAALPCHAHSCTPTGGRCE